MSCCSRRVASCPPTGMVLQARDLFVNQGLLTGETFPVEKQAGAVAA